MTTPSDVAAVTTSSDASAPTTSPTTPASAGSFDRMALGAGMVTVVLWASAFVGIRAAGAEISPGPMAFGRLAIGVLALGILVVIRPWRRPSNRDLVLIVASGVLWLAGYNLALNEAERYVDAGTAVMIVNTGPILIALMAGIFLREGLPGRLFLGLAIAFAGTVLIAVATSGDGGTSAVGDTNLGIVLCLVAALGYAAGVTIQKPALHNVSALHVTWLACVVGAAVCLPFAPQLVDEIGDAEPVNIAWLVFLGLGPTAVAFTTWAFALSRMPAGRLGSLTYLITPIVIVMAWLLLGEVPTVLVLGGGVLCVIGVLVARSGAWSWRRSLGRAPGR